MIVEITDSLTVTLRCLSPPRPTGQSLQRCHVVRFCCRQLTLEFLCPSTDRFFLVVQARDERFDAETTRGFLESLEPREVVVIEP